MTLSDILSSVFSINIDHVSIAMDIVIVLLPSPNLEFITITKHDHMISQPYAGISITEQKQRKREISLHKFFTMETQRAYPWLRPRDDVTIYSMVCCIDL